MMTFVMSHPIITFLMFLATLSVIDNVFEYVCNAIVDNKIKGE